MGRSVFVDSNALVPFDTYLPGGSFAERDGTFVNHAGLAQEIHKAIRSPGEAKPETVRLTAELCDGADNDCNGRTDDNVTDAWSGQVPSRFWYRTSSSSRLGAIRPPALRRSPS